MPLANLLADYERVRATYQRQLESNIRHVAMLDPTFEEIARRRGEATRSIATAIRRGTPARQATAEAQAALEALAREEATLLHKAGLPDSYLTLQHRCAACGDTGYVGEAPRRMCSCLMAALMEEERASSRIDPLETFETFDDSIFPDEAQRRQMRKARMLAERYADSLPACEKHNLVLLGMAGLGKTFLLNCIASRALSHGIALKKVTAYTLFDEILEGIRAYSSAIGPYLRVPLLLIDDLGTEPMLNNITRESLFAILNERRNGRLHTVVASNLNLEGLQDLYGERIFSRLISRDDADVLLLSGQNLRLFGRRETP